MRRLKKGHAKYAYDPEHRLIEIMDSEGAVTVYVYKEGSDCRAVVHPDGSTTIEKIPVPECPEGLTGRFVRRPEPGDPDYIDDAE